jgi:putative transposase
MPAKLAACLFLEWSKNLGKLAACPTAFAFPTCSGGCLTQKYYSMVTRELLTRRHLPHWYQPGHAHFVTYRLAGSIPTRLLREWQAERERLSQRQIPAGTSATQRRIELQRRFFLKYDRFLDSSRDNCWLVEAGVSAIVRENLYHHAGTKYQLLAYCVMPNHVHVLFQPLDAESAAVVSVGQAASLPVHAAPTVPKSGEAGSFADVQSDELPDRRGPLASIMHSLKSYTANEANRFLEREGEFWQHESYDHWVRNLDELDRITTYIAWNPVRAGLCAKPVDWQFSSAADRFREDGSDSALVGWLRDDWHSP